MKPLIASAATLICLLLVAPGSASAKGDPYKAFYQLAVRNLKPAPLVPVAVPKSLSPLQDTLHHVTRRSEKSYVFRFEAENKSGDIDRRVGVEGGLWKSFNPPLTQARKLGLIIKKDKVRKRKAYTIRSRSMHSLQLLWKENGIIYTVSTPTDKKISLKDLKVIANGLEVLQREFIGGFYDKSGGQGAIAVTTNKSITVDIEWNAACTRPDGEFASPRGGSITTEVMPLANGGFSFSLIPGVPADNPWTLTASGTVSSGAVALNYRASGTIDGYACDTGPIAINLDGRQQP
jgi:hypothetical protein